MRQFYLLMAEKTHTVVYALDEDLGAPVFFLDAISDLRTILSAYDSSLAPTSSDSTEISTIMDSSLAPYLKQCEQMAKTLPELSRNILLSNCYDLAKVNLRNGTSLT
jgi:Conserved oligomeric complex COG6